MPHLRFRSLASEQVQELSRTLPEKLAAAMQTSADNFTFEVIGTTFFSQGKEVKSYPFVEVLWFERTRDIQDLSARLITEHVKAFDPQEDIVVVFINLPKNSYYENGEHF